jgi:hypothetical protein
VPSQPRGTDIGRAVELTSSWLGDLRGVGEVNRRPGLFIYLIIFVFYDLIGSVWAPSWSAQSLLRRDVLCDLCLDIYGLRGRKVSVMTASCVQTWSNAVFQVPLICFRADLCEYCSAKAKTAAHVTVRDVRPPLRGISVTFPYEKARFTTIKELLLAEMASQIAPEAV